MAESIRLSSGALLSKDAVKDLAIKCCHQRLLHELHVVNPRVIVPLGNVELKQLTNITNAKIYAYRGSIQEIDTEALIDQYNKMRYV